VQINKQTNTNSIKNLTTVTAVSVGNKTSDTYVRNSRILLTNCKITGHITTLTLHITHQMSTFPH